MMMDAMSVEELKGFRFVPIVFGMSGNKRTLEIPGIMQIQVEGIPHQVLYNIMPLPIILYIII